MDTGRHRMHRHIFLAIFVLAIGILLWVMPGVFNPVGADVSDPVSGDIIYIQPLGDVEKDKLNSIKAILDKRFNKKVVLLPGKKLA